MIRFNTLAVVVLAGGILVSSGCALLDTSTQTKDGDLKSQLGEYKGMKHAM